MLASCLCVLVLLASTLPLGQTKDGPELESEHYRKALENSVSPLNFLQEHGLLPGKIIVCFFFICNSN